MCFYPQVTEMKPSIGQMRKPVVHLSLILVSIVAFANHGQVSLSLTCREDNDLYRLESRSPDYCDVRIGDCQSEAEYFGHTTVLASWIMRRAKSLANPVFKVYDGTEAAVLPGAVPRPDAVLLENQHVCLALDKEHGSRSVDRGQEP